MMLRQGRINQSLTKRLLAIDTSFALIRHISCVSVEATLHELDDQLLTALPAAAAAAPCTTGTHFVISCEQRAPSEDGSLACQTPSPWSSPVLMSSFLPVVPSFPLLDKAVSMSAAVSEELDHTVPESETANHTLQKQAPATQEHEPATEAAMRKTAFVCTDKHMKRDMPVMSANPYRRDPGGPPGSSGQALDAPHLPAQAPDAPHDAPHSPDQAPDQAPHFDSTDSDKRGTECVDFIAQVILATTRVLVNESPLPSVLASTVIDSVVSHISELARSGSDLVNSGIASRVIKSRAKSKWFHRAMDVLTSQHRLIRRPMRGGALLSFP